MMHLYIPPEGELRLKFNADKVERFSSCELQYVKNGSLQTLYEDYLYFFVEEMLERIRNIPTLNGECGFGEVGKWQEYFYFDRVYNEKHYEEIAIMKKAIFVSMESYGAFLYKYNEKLWFELDRGFREPAILSPLEYYQRPDNYRVSLDAISTEVLETWKEQLEKIEKLL